MSHVFRFAEYQYTPVVHTSLLPGTSHSVSACIDQLAPFVSRHVDVFFVINWQ